MNWLSFFLMVHDRIVTTRQVELLAEVLVRLRYMMQTRFRVTAWGPTTGLCRDDVAIGFALKTASVQTVNAHRPPGSGSR